MNEIENVAGYTQVAEFTKDYHTPKNPEGLTPEADRDYSDYNRWLARTADGGCDIVSFGY